MINVKLLRLQSNHDNLRTDEVIGETAEKPLVGSRFTIYAPPLEGGQIRVVSTSPVKELWWHPDGDVCTFKTQNSTYVLTLT